MDWFGGRVVEGVVGEEGMEDRVYGHLYSIMMEVVTGGRPWSCAARICYNSVVICTFYLFRYRVNFISNTYYI